MLLTYPGYETYPITAFLAQPNGSGTFPGIVFIMKAFGLVYHIKDIARELAREGYNTLPPELYTREGPPNPEDLTTVGPTMFNAPDKRVVGNLQEAANFLHSLPTANGKIGTLGFCSGGRQSLVFACNTQSVSVAIDCYGGFITQEKFTPQRPKSPINMIPDLPCPPLGLFGNDDQNPSPTHIESLRKNLKNYGKEFEFHSDPETGHGLFDNYRPSYNHEVAHDAWKHVLNWFSNNLSST